MDWQDLAKRHPELPCMMEAPGSSFAGAMGGDWAGRHPGVPLFLEPGELRRFQETGRLEPAEMIAAMERFLSRRSVFHDRSGPAEQLKALYRDLLLGTSENYLGRLDARLKASMRDPGALAGLAVLALSVWAPDPRGDPKSWRLWFMAGFAFDQLDELEAAAEFLEPAIRLDPSATLSLDELAQVRLRQGRLQEAEALLGRAMALDPRDIQALCLRARVCLAAGDEAQARAFLDKAREIDPEEPMLKGALADIERREGAEPRPTLPQAGARSGAIPWRSWSEETRRFISEKGHPVLLLVEDPAFAGPTGRLRAAMEASPELVALLRDYAPALMLRKDSMPEYFSALGAGGSYHVAVLSPSGLTPLVHAPVPDEPAGLVAELVKVLTALQGVWK